MKLIEKDAVLAIIEKRKQRIYPKRTDYTDGQKSELVNLSLEINALETKEIDFEREMQAFAALYLEPLKISDTNIGISITMEQLYSCARKFFNLGLRVSNPLTWEDINSILYIERLVLREFGGQEHSNEELCREVLKRFKEQKGERYENNND